MIRLPLMSRIDQAISPAGYIGLMPYEDWQQAAELLDQRWAPPSDGQLQLAVQHGIPLIGDEPFAVVAAMLEDWLCPMIHGKRPRSVTGEQTELLRKLAGQALGARVEHLTVNIASAWIGCWIARRRAAELRRLQVRRGDLVELRRVFLDTGEVIVSRHVVTSIGRDGLVYVRGQHPPCARPDELEVVAKLVPQARACRHAIKSGNKHLAGSAEAIGAPPSVEILLPSPRTSRARIQPRGLQADQTPKTLTCGCSLTSGRCASGVVSGRPLGLLGRGARFWAPTVGRFDGVDVACAGYVELAPSCPDQVGTAATSALRISGWLGRCVLGSPCCGGSQPRQGQTRDS